MAIWKQKEILVYSKRQAQIRVKTQIEAQIEVQVGALFETWVKAQFGALLFDEAPINVLIKYFNYSDVFLVENAAKISDYTMINDNAI